MNPENITFPEPEGIKYERTGTKTMLQKKAAYQPNPGIGNRAETCTPIYPLATL